MGIIKRIWGVFRKALYWICSKIFHLFHKELSQEAFFAILQFVKFGLVGVSNTIVNYVVYVLALLGLRALHLFPTFDVYAAQGVSFVISVLWSFLLNNFFVFKEDESEKGSRNLLLALLKTYASYALTGLLLNMLLLYVWVDLVGISEFLAPILNLLITVPLNFVLNKFWAFRSKKKDE